MGAFNARSPEWWKNDHTAAEGPQVESLTSSYVLIQVISQPTPILLTSTSCIDLIFTNQPNLVIKNGVHASLLPNSYHLFVFTKLNHRISFNIRTLYSELPKC